MDAMKEALKRKLDMIKGAVDDLHQDIVGGEQNESPQEESAETDQSKENDPAKLDMAPSLDESKTSGAEGNDAGMAALSALAGMGGHNGRGPMSLEERGANAAKGRIAQMKKK